MSKLIPEGNALVFNTSPQYLVIQGETMQVRIALTDTGLDGFAKAWRELLKLPEVQKILKDFELLEERGFKN